MPSKEINAKTTRWLALNHLVEINRLLGKEHRVGMTNRPNHSPQCQIQCGHQCFL